jgi:chromosome segregation ATPase
MADTGQDGGFKERITKQGEDALGKIAQDLLENPFVVSAISRAFDARERAVQAQETAMSALNIPSAADIERLTRRLRSVSQRMEGLEEAVDRVDGRLESVARAPGGGIDDRLAAIEDRLARLGIELSHLTAALDAPPRAVHREQSRLLVDAPAKPAAAKRAAKKQAASSKRAAKKRAASSKPAASSKAAAKAKPAAKKRAAG